MTVGEYAKSRDFKIVGKLTRRPGWETGYRLGKKTAHIYAYIDEDGNEYYVGKGGACIVTKDGKVI